MRTTDDFDVDDHLIRRRPLRHKIGAIGVVLALGVGVTGGLWRAIVGPSSEPRTVDAPIVVVSSGPTYSSLEELVAASDVVVIGRAIAVAPGRLFSTGGRAGIRSQLVTLEVGAVLAGQDPGPTVVIEEEAAIADGRPIVVDGLRPTSSGDQGIFFLIASPDPDVPYYATVSTAGRYLRVTAAAGDDRLLGATGPDALAPTLAAIGGDEMTDRILAAGRA